MKHIVSLSGGKDSTAMLLRMLELDMPVDLILFFDGGWEFPQTYQHLRELEDSMGLSITTLKPERSFDYWMYEHEAYSKHREVKRIGYGWPSPSRRWCTREKGNALRRAIKPYRAEGFREYIGIAYDETDRFLRSSTLRRPGAVFPLVEWEWTEADCLKYCYSRGFDWSGLYEYFAHVSCFCCPLSRLGELRNMYHYFPDLWQRLREMQARTYNGFKDDKTIFDLEERFAREDRQLEFSFER